MGTKTSAVKTPVRITKDRAEDLFVQLDVVDMAMNNLDGVTSGTVHGLSLACDDDSGRKHCTLPVEILDQIKSILTIRRANLKKKLLEAGIEA